MGACSSSVLHYSDNLCNQYEMQETEDIFSDFWNNQQI